MYVESRTVALYQWRKEKMDIRIGGSEAVLWGRSAVDQIRKREMYGKKKRKKEKKDGRVGTGGKCVMKEASARSSE